MKESNGSESLVGRGLRPRDGAALNVCMRTVFVAYLITLTVLLLTRDPTKLVQVQPLLLRLLSPVAHLLSFLLLGLLAFAARWPVAWWVVVLSLVAYGGGTESLQGLISGRTPEWADWLQDVAGIAISVPIYRLAAVAWHYFEGSGNTHNDGASDNGKSS